MTEIVIYLEYGSITVYWDEDMVHTYDYLHNQIKVAKDTGLLNVGDESKHVFHIIKYDKIHRIALRKAK